jgi:RNA polymerase sigma-70 factor, ECF subfamily
VRSDLEAAFRDLRPYAFAIAYRMLGSVAEAEDVTQEAFLRLGQAGGTEVRSARSYVATVTTRLAIDVLRSARVRRESYAGPWLPEPVLDEPDAAAALETADSLSLAFLVVLEALNPVERAVFLLHDVFDFGYGEIAGMLDRSQAACRQAASRARRRVREERPRSAASREQREALSARFFAAAQGQDMAGLVELLTADAVLYGDGGTKGNGLSRPVYGREGVAAMVLSWFRQGARIGARVEPALVNGQPGARFLDGAGRLINVLALDIADGRVQAVRSVINPDKLGHLGELSPYGLRARRTGLEWSAGDPTGDPTGDPAGTESAGPEDVSNR